MFKSPGCLFICERRKCWPHLPFRLLQELWEKSFGKDLVNPNSYTNDCHQHFNGISFCIQSTLTYTSNLQKNKSLEIDTAFLFWHSLKIYTTLCISSQAKALESNTSSLWSTTKYIFLSHSHWTISPMYSIYMIYHPNFSLFPNNTKTQVPDWTFTAQICVCL